MGAALSVCLCGYIDLLSYLLRSTWWFRGTERMLCSLTVLHTLQPASAKHRVLSRLFQNWLVVETSSTGTSRFQWFTALKTASRIRVSRMHHRLAGDGA
jgi:hypothetical protein